MKKSLSDSHGQAIVEFAIILPVFILLFLAVMQLGVFLYLEVRASSVAWSVAHSRQISNSETAAAITGKISSTAQNTHGMDITVKQIKHSDSQQYITVTTSIPVPTILANPVIPKTAQGQVTVRVVED